MPPLPDAHALINAALEEDFSYGADITTVATVPADARAAVTVSTRADGVVAGLGYIKQVLHACARRLNTSAVITVDIAFSDGAQVSAGDVLATIKAPTRVLLSAERTLLNLISHLSGIATETHRWAEALAGTHTTVRDTRKTLPGMRAVQKYAVLAGGGANHRMGLGDVAMIKDNHISAAGGCVAQALRMVRAQDPTIDCEVEVDTLAQLDEVLPLHPQVVLLDNFIPAQVAVAVERRQALSPHTALEASGGLSLESAGDYAATGVDFLAVGALTHSVRALDIGLDF